MQTHATLILAFLVGCAPTAPSNSADATGGPATIGDDTSELGTATVDGQLMTLSGDPVVDCFVTVSDDYCVPDRTTEDGSFAVEKVGDGPRRLITYGETASSGPFASVVLPIEVTGDTKLATPIVLPRLDERHPIDLEAIETQVITSDDGLRLMIEPGNLTIAPFFDPEILVARVPVSAAPPFVPAGVEIIDLHVLHPIRSTFEAPARLELPPSPGLTPGAAVIFHALDYETGLLAPVATGTVNDEGAPITSPGEGILELTWIGVSLQ